MKKDSKLIPNLMLTLAAMIWGSQFVLQKIAAQYIGPITFFGLRSLIGTITLVILVFIFEKNKRKEEEKQGISHVPYGKAYFKKLITTAPWCVFINVFGNVLVQAGLKYTAASKAGFLNAIYIIFVPVLSFIIFKKKTSVFTWIGTGIAVIGLYLLCIKGDFSIEKGDLLILCCTIPFAVHILLVSKYVHVFQGLHFSLAEFLSAGIVCTIVGLLTEESNWTMYTEFLPGILYCGILGTGVCYALQVTAQKKTDPTVAALLMSLESVFAAITGMIFLKESFTLREFFGVILICSAIVFAQIPPKEAKNSIKKA